MEEAAEGVKCEDLEKIVVGDDPKKFFQVEAQLPPQEGRTNRVSQKEHQHVRVECLQSS